MAMKMRQSLAQLEQEFRHEVQRDKSRQHNLTQNVQRRARQRGIQRERAKSSVRFWLLVLALAATAVIVTVAMFETLYYLLA